MLMRRPCFVSSTSTGVSTSTVWAANIITSHVVQPQRYETARSLSASDSLSLPALLTSLKVFDGSEVTDPVVISNTFWSNLASKLPYLFLAQLLASITFVAIASFVTSQGKFLVDQVAPNEKTQLNGKAPKFRRASMPQSQPLALDFTKLALCICIDIVGSANEVVPLVGEVVDIAYAPIAALLLRGMFSGSNVVFLLEFTEEILPFTDILPLATICWVVETFFGDGSLAYALKIGQFAPSSAKDQESVKVGDREKDKR